jgi:hypothetical protein
MGGLHIFSNKIKNIFLSNTFSINLLSIKKITQELNCDMIFFFSK